MVEGLDSTISAVVFIGYHGRAGSAGSFAAHTGSGRVGDVRVNGVSLGEGGLNTMFAAWFGVPVVFVSGDVVAVQQIRDLIRTVEGQAVKTGIWDNAVRTMLPDSAQAAIQRGVSAALRMRRARFIPTVETPFEVEMEFTSHLYADIAEGIPGVRRVDYTTVAFTTDEYPAAYRMIRVLYKHLTP
jgi:D-amino peptidase